MPTTENAKEPFIYSNALGRKVYPHLEPDYDPTHPFDFKAFYREATRVRKREQYHGRCFCPKAFIWKCDSDCDCCEYHFNQTVSLDEERTEDGATLLDCLEGSVHDAVTAASFENVVEDRMLLDELFDKLRELTDDADKIIALWEEDYKISDRKVAEALGIPQRTFADLMKKYRSEARRIRGF